MPHASPVGEESEILKESDILKRSEPPKILKFELNFEKTRIIIETDDENLLNEILKTINDVTGSDSIKAIIGNVNRR